MGATRPDGSSAKTERVVFTRNAADRIADAVLEVERGNRDSQGLAWYPRMDGGRAGGGEKFRVCTFTGSWSKNSAKELTLANQTATPNTVLATNRLYDIAAVENTTTQRVCVIGKEGSEWYFVNNDKLRCAGNSYTAEELSPGSADSESTLGGAQEGGGGMQVLVNDRGCVRWYRCSMKSVLLGVQLTGDGLEFVQKDVWVIDTPGEGQTVTIAAEDCPP